MVRQIPDERFQREGDDLIVHARIRLEDALSEGKVDVPHLDGRVLRVPLKEVGSPCSLRNVQAFLQPDGLSILLVRRCLMTMKNHSLSSTSTMQRASCPKPSCSQIG